MTANKLWKYIFLALIICASLAASSNLFAQSVANDYYRMAVNYHKGENGFATDVAEAMKWYLKAAEAGNAAAQGFVGSSYFNGENGVSKDEEQGVSWFQKAAPAGNAESQFYLSVCYNRGMGGLKKNPEKVRYWQKQLLESDKTGEFINHLARFYYYRQSSFPVEKEDIKGLYLTAAERGDSSAQIALAKLYEPVEMLMDKLFEVDKAKAIFWYKQAARQGEPRAIKALKTNFGITVFDDNGPATQPEIIPCPITGHPLIKTPNNLESGAITYQNPEEEVISGAAVCTYEDGSTITLEWKSAQNYATNKSIQDYCASLDERVHIEDNLYSEGYTHNRLEPLIGGGLFPDVESARALAGVSLDLSEKEQGNREKWIEWAKKSLLIAEKRAAFCLEDEKLDAVSGARTSPRERTTGSSQDDRGNNAAQRIKPPPQAWDAPSPKAKIPD